MRELKILVTGGCGFIGSHFVNSFSREPDVSILNIDLLTYASNKENVFTSSFSSGRYNLFVGDISDRFTVEKLVRNFRPNWIVHFAAESHVDRSIDSAAPFCHTNVLGTLNLLEVAKSYFESLEAELRPCFRFLHISTDEVYGSLGPNDSGFTESSLYAPNSPYAASKAASDHFVRAFFKTYGLPVLTSHCSNNYGPHQYPEKLIPFFIKRALQGESLPVYGDGKNCRDWLYVSDHVVALKKILEKGRLGEVYNIGGGTELSNNDIVDLLCRELDVIAPRKQGGSYKSMIRYVSDRKGHDFRYSIDSSKIKVELGWSPEFQFESAFSTTVKWFVEQYRKGAL